MDSCFSGMSADCRAEVGACEASGGPCYLAWWQENRPAGRGDDTVVIIVHQHQGLMYRKLFIVKYCPTVCSELVWTKSQYNNDSLELEKTNNPPPPPQSLRELPVSCLAAAAVWTLATSHSNSFIGFLVLLNAHTSRFIIKYPRHTHIEMDADVWMSNALCPYVTAQLLATINFHQFRCKCYISSWPLLWTGLLLHIITFLATYKILKSLRHEILICKIWSEMKGRHFERLQSVIILYVEEHFL